MRKRGVVLLCLCWMQSAGAAEVFRWVDNNSVVNYSDQMPVGMVKDVEQRKISANVIDAQPSYALNFAAARHPVILYSEDCGALCASARSLLDKRGIPYTLKNPQMSKSDADELNKMTGALRVPVLKVGDQVYKGFQQEMWNAALDQAGYPKSAMPGAHVAPASTSALKPAEAQTDGTPPAAPGKDR